MDILLKIPTFITFPALFLVLFVVSVLLISIVWWTIWGLIKKPIFRMHYRKVAEYLDTPAIVLESLSDGEISGNYKGRPIRWTMYLTMNERLLPATFVSCKLNTIPEWFSKYNSTYFTSYGRRGLNKTRVALEGSLRYKELSFIFYRLFLEGKEIKKLLEVVHLIVEKFENNEINICFHCGGKIGLKPATCSKCGWFWSNSESPQRRPELGMELRNRY